MVIEAEYTPGDRGYSASIFITAVVLKTGYRGGEVVKRYPYDPAGRLDVVSDGTRVWMLGPASPAQVRFIHVLDKKNRRAASALGVRLAGLDEVLASMGPVVLLDRTTRKPAPNRSTIEKCLRFEADFIIGCMTGKITPVEVADEE